MGFPIVEQGASFLQSVSGPLLKYGVNGVLIGAMMVVGTYLFNFSLPVVKAVIQIAAGVIIICDFIKIECLYPYYFYSSYQMKCLKMEDLWI